ncbi:helix-turn-helix domain-containing protein [Candidatus Sodalis endolongispinus]|uniref:Helix-turn-helix domain-containing protein n=1 Tax=Candidatus Sodalis endolongispinus TaxID=2812662 RepID=A0ABS5YES6_9GAMM|nr:IclR family transcriptional regulator C-terminal domain-containing protein [Candidatus Sodalis endolongispinus]MBT9433446.1 helix-turn-helix domain-containing protein [Candidatus Sodalis endolongispinus]
MSILETSAQILQLMTSLQRGIRVNDFINHIQMPKSTASRVVNQLVQYGYLEKDDAQGHFMPGALLLGAAHIARQQVPLNERVDAALRSLCERTCCTGYISLLDNREILVLRVIHGRHALPMVTWPGSRSPACGTLTGRALLARLSEDEIDEFFASAPVATQLNGVHQSEDSIRRLIQQTRERGYATAINESVTDTASVSCAVGDPATHEAVAFCLSLPQSLAHPEEIVRLAGLLRDAARLIARKTGDMRVTETL